MPKYISKAQINANQRNISDLRYLARNNIIVPYSLDTHKNSTVSKSPLGFAACLSKNPRISQSSASPYIKKSCKFFQSYEKIIVIGSNLGNSLQTSRVYAEKKVILQQENKKL